MLLSTEEDEHETVSTTGSEHESMLDSYLTVRWGMSRCWQPLVTYVEVEALPKGASVELQPLALSAAAWQVRDHDCSRRDFSFRPGTAPFSLDLWSLLQMHPEMCWKVLDCL